jgi:hypothetical protein
MNQMNGDFDLFMMIYKNPGILFFNFLVTFQFPFPRRGIYPHLILIGIADEEPVRACKGHYCADL